MSYYFGFFVQIIINFAIYKSEHLTGVIPKNSICSLNENSYYQSYEENINQLCFMFMCLNQSGTSRKTQISYRVSSRPNAMGLPLLLLQ